MRKVIGVVVVIVGVLLAVAGGAVGVLFRSGDTVTTGSSTVPLDGAVALVSTAGVTAWSGGTLIVRASSSTGPVFVGAGHPVDVRDYLGSRARVEIVSVGVSGVGTHAVAGAGSPGALADPGAQTWWAAKASGAGSQELRVRLDGTPVQYAVLPATPDKASVTLTVAMRVAGARVAGVVSAVVGLLLVGLGWWVLRRGRRPAREVAGSRRRRGMGVGMGVALLVPAVAGCGTVPRPTAAWDPATVAKQGLTSAQLPAMLKDYDTRNNAAILATHTSGDPQAWGSADTGTLLDSDWYSTRYAAARGDSEPTVISGTHEGSLAYSPEFTAYPMFVAVPLTERWSSGGSHDFVMVFTKKSSTAPWLGTSAYVSRSQPLPAPATGAAATPTAADRARVEKAAQDVLAGAEGKPSTIASYGDLPQVHGWALKYAGETAEVRTQVRFYRSSDVKDAVAKGAVRAVRMSDGSVLALVDLTLDHRITGKGGQGVAYDETRAKAFRRPDYYPEITLVVVCSVGVIIGADGSTMMHGSSCSNVLPEGL